MSEMFSSPAAASGINWSDLNGSLLMVEVAGIETGVKTSLGEKDAVRATVHDVDKGEVYDDVLVFPRVLISQLRSRVGSKVLGRLGQGAAKPGQSAPWMLHAATEADQRTAVEYVTRRNTNTFDAPAAASSAPPF